MYGDDDEIETIEMEVDSPSDDLVDPHDSPPSRERGALNQDKTTTTILSDIQLNSRVCACYIL